MSLIRPPQLGERSFSVALPATAERPLDVEKVGIKEVLVAAAVVAVGTWRLATRDDGEPRPPPVADRSPQTSVRPVEQPQSDRPIRPNRDPTADDYREAVAIYKGLQELLKASKEMEPLRHTGDIDDEVACVDRMHELLPIADGLSERADVVPRIFADIGTAAGHMERCVTCVPNAKFDCERAVFFMKRVHELLPKKPK